MTDTTTPLTPGNLPRWMVSRDADALLYRSEFPHWTGCDDDATHFGTEADATAAARRMRRNCIPVSVIAR